MEMMNIAPPKEHLKSAGRSSMVRMREFPNPRAALRPPLPHNQWGEDYDDDHPNAVVVGDEELGLGRPTGGRFSISNPLMQEDPSSWAWSESEDDVEEEDVAAELQQQKQQQQQQQSDDNDAFFCFCERVFTSSIFIIESTEHKEKTRDAVSHARVSQRRR